MGGWVSSPSTTDLSSTAEYDQVKNLVADNPVMVFSKTYCPYCRTAKNIFTDLGVEAKVLELDRVNNGAAMQNVLQALTSARTVRISYIS